MNKSLLIGMLFLVFSGCHFNQKSPEGMMRNAKAELHFIKGIFYYETDSLENVGNYFEIVNNRDSAIYYYHLLYQEDTVYYKFCLKRALELKSPTVNLLKGLVYQDRNPPLLILRGMD